MSKKMETETLFKLWGKIKWIDKNDEPHFFFIPKDTKSPLWFKWAADENTIVRLFKREIQQCLKEGLSLKYSLKFHRILLDEATIQPLKTKKGSQ